MIVIPDALQARLDAGATTLAWCWRMTRRDGAVFAFTEHDEPLTLDGEVFEAAAGVSPGAMRSENVQSSALCRVWNGRALAPPAEACSSGVSTSRNPSASR